MGLWYGMVAFGVVHWSDWDKRGVFWVSFFGYLIVNTGFFRAVAICHLRNLAERLILYHLLMVYELNLGYHPCWFMAGKQKRRRKNSFSTNKEKSNRKII